MNQKCNQAEQAAKELNILINEGFFGETSKDLMEMQDSMTTPQFIYECFTKMFNKSEYGCNSIIQYLTSVFNLFAEAIEVNINDAFEIITAFFTGTAKHPELEYTSSYAECISFFAEANRTLELLEEKNEISNSDRKRCAAFTLTSYSKGVELAGKIFTQLLTLEQFIHHKPADIYKNSKLSINKKTEEFLKLSQGRYDYLTEAINRKIRNADSHLGMYFSIEENAYIIKSNFVPAGQKKKEAFIVKWEDMQIDIYPRAVWFIKGYFGACMLLILRVLDNDKYVAAKNHIDCLVNNDRVT